MIKINRESVRNMSRAFILTGIILPSFVNTSSISYLDYVKTCLIPINCGAAFLSVAIYIYEHRSLFREYVIGIPFICCGLTYMMALFSFIKMRNKMSYLLQRINENIFTYTQESQIQVKYSWLCSETNTQKIHFYVFVSQFIGMVSCVILLCDHLVLKRTNDLTFPGWTPWDPEEYFMTTFMVQLVLSISGCSLMFVIQLFIVFVTIEFFRQNTRLCAALSTIHQRTENTAMMNKTHMKGDKNEQNESIMKNLLARVFEYNLKQCIQHHQILMKLFQIFESWFSILFQFELLAGSLSFAIVFYNFFQTSTEVAYVALISSGYVFILTLLSRCIAGEIFSEMNEKIARVIFYEVRWYEQSLSNKRLLSIFHSQVCRPMDLYAFSIFKASFFTFTSLMRTSYSYLNILKASFGSKN